ncbi:unnamed protein product [Litomosoides sigmodontis]|uniref:Tudor domain-containing protein n=1 Tax=Litomosoides sigmodontis TaxID=42156 RepID=A0A3P6UTP3_LITSI|nr:unnamed protein product [Litomosoides sigmodontis]
MSEELINVVNFDGFVSHVGDSGEPSEVIVYVTHVVSDDSKMPGRSEMGVMRKSRARRNHVNNNDINYGAEFTIRVGDCVERVAAKNISENERLIKVRIIDKGIDVEVERNALFPSSSQAKIVTNCVCPILVVGANEEQKQVAAQISGRECRCVNGNLVVIPSVGFCVKGQLLISYGNDGYAELKDISLETSEGEERFEDMTRRQSQLSRYARPFRYRYTSTRCCRNFPNDNDEQRYERRKGYGGAIDAYGNEAHTFTGRQWRRQWNNSQLHKNTLVIENSASSNPNSRNGYFPNAKFDCVHEEMNGTCAMVSRRNEYAPNAYPRTIRIRFDKIDSSSEGTFWVFEPNIFTTIERILHEGRQRYSSYPHFDQSIVKELRGVGCLVRASVDSGYRSLCRAEIIKFVKSTQRPVFRNYFISLSAFSVYLVDYGFHKWIKFNDVFDISMINKRDNVVYLPIALLRCRLAKHRGGIRLRRLERGGEYEITMMSRDSDGIFNVYIDQVGGHRRALVNTDYSIISDNSIRSSSWSCLFQDNLFTEFAEWFSCSSLQFVYDAFAKAFQRSMESIDEEARGNSLISTVMANSLTFSSNWPSGFSIPYPMFIPIMMPPMLNFDDIIDREGHDDQICTMFGRGDDASGCSSLIMSKNMRYRNRRSSDRSLSNRESRYRAIEQSSSEISYNSSFDEYDDLHARNVFFGHRNSNWCGRRRGKNGAYRGRRPGKYSRISYASDSDEEGSCYLLKKLLVPSCRF